MALDGRDAARLLLDRLAREHPDLRNRLSVEDTGGALLVKSGVPGRAEHELSVLLLETEATVGYSDGLAPGPAEKLFVWGDAPVSDGVEAVARFVDGLIRGETLLVRERIPLLARLIRGDGAGSLLWFVPAAEWAGWPPRRRRAIERAWAWSPDRKLAI